MSAYLSFLTVLGWSLLDSVWQMAVLWMVYWLLTTGNNRISPAGKHNLVLLFAFIGVEWFIYNFIHQLDKPRPVFADGLRPAFNYANQWIPFATAAYLISLIVRLAHHTLRNPGWRSQKSGIEPSRAYQLFTDRYARLLGIRRRVQVCLSGLVETAETSGFLKPIILLPFSLLTRLSPQQLEAILVHELLHIRRNDYFINICMLCVRNIFFFNPFARLFYKAMARERELACDDGVLEMGFEPGVYADALFSLEKLRQVYPGFSLAADGNRPWLLMERIRRLLGKPVVLSKRLNPLYYLILFLSILLSGLKVTAPVPDKVLKKLSPPVAVELTRYETPGMPVNLIVPETISRPAIRRKPVRKQNLKILPSLPDALPESESAPREQAFFADDKLERNYSNQAAAALTRDLVREVPGSPYIPSASLYYESMPVIEAEDSMKTIVVENALKEQVRLSRMKSIALLKSIEIEIDKSKKLLNQEESKNQELIIINQKNLKPELNKIRRQIEIKKNKIEHLRIRLQDSEEEIIHM